MEKGSLLHNSFAGLRWQVLHASCQEVSKVLPSVNIEELR